MLAVMAYVRLESVRALDRIETEEAQITHTFQVRHELVDQIQSSACLSSISVLEYLLESNQEATRLSLVQLRHLRHEMNSAIRDYSTSIRPGEEKLISDLTAEVGEYWKALEPALQGHARTRASQDYRYLEMQVVPRRDRTIAIAAKIKAINEQEFSNDRRRAADLFVQLQQRVTVILGLALCAGSILAAVCIAQIVRADKDARLPYEENRPTQEEVKGLSARLADAQEQERRAISRELHDQVGQSLSVLRVTLFNLSAITAPENQEAHRLLRTAGSLTDDSIKSTRNIALVLRPSMLDDLGLVAALGWQAREISRCTGIRVDLVADDSPNELPEEHKTCVYRIVQEALRNASRHSGAHRVRIGVQQEQEYVLLTIQDDGNGFDARVVRGLGLLGMEERVKHLGGSFNIQSRIGEGTLLTVSLPLVAPYVPALCVTV